MKRCRKYSIKMKNQTNFGGAAGGRGVSDPKNTVNHQMIHIKDVKIG
jgi:hypothetical protein